ncbi:MAG: hypothetical protein HN826_13705, partial [Methylococcales bacterium]|nr:hypothetical protein [Methylococcales bacterium]
MKFTQYFSGCTNISDFVGTSEIAQKPVCIVANDVSQKVMPKIVNALNSGLKIMIDSGAFPRYKANLKRQSNNMSLLADLDFNEVFESYDRIIKQISVENYSNLTIVAPDKIGDQEKTLELQQKYRQKIT